MACEECNSTKYTCGDRKQNANCTFIDKDVLNKYSKLKDEDCIVTAETTKELYSMLEELNDTSEFEESCLEIEKNDEGKITPKQVTLAIIEKICDNDINEHEGSVHNPINGFCNNLNYHNLIEDECNLKPSNTCEFMQFVLDTLKQLKDEAK